MIQSSSRLIKSETPHTFFLILKSTQVDSLSTFCFFRDHVTVFIEA